MSILADLTTNSGLIDYKITVGNLISIVCGIGTVVAAYYKLKSDMAILKLKDDEQGKLIIENSKTIEQLDKNGSSSFRQYKEMWEKQLNAYDLRFGKIEDILGKVEKMGAQLEFIVKWIDKQDKN